MASTSLMLRLKAKNGQHVVKQLTLESTLQDLKSKVEDLTKIPSTSVKILHGFPPKPMDISSDNAQLSTLHIRSGDTLIVEEDASIKREQETKKNERFAQEIQSQFQNAGGILTRQVVPANNSCLFTSVHFVMEGGKLDLNCASGMRELIATIVSSDPEKFNEGFLGKPNADYCAWILHEESWGGAIEISILSQYYNTEIDVVDTQTVRIDRFGEDQQYKNRVMLLYDGIHYDPLMLESVDPGIPPSTVFSTNNDIVLQQGLELAAEAKSSRQFVDVKKFTLRCLICQTPLTGGDQAQVHAKETGHINFGEV